MRRIVIAPRHPHDHVVHEERPKPQVEVICWVLDTLHATYEMQRRVRPMRDDADDSQAELP
jgi:hypothetical protein